MDGSPAEPPCESLWFLRYILSAISPARLTTSTFCVPDATLFFLASKSCGVLVGL